MEPKRNFLFQFIAGNKKWFILLLIAVLAVGGQYISRKFLEKKHATELMETRQELQTEAELILSENTKTQLSLMLKTFVWAVRSSMLRDNLDEVDQYFYQLVKEDKITDIILVGQDEQIMVATNKKYEAKSFSDYYSLDLINQADVFFNKEGSTYHVSAPVLSLNSRLGTLVFVYQGAEINFTGEKTGVEKQKE